MSGSGLARVELASQARAVVDGAEEPFTTALL